MPYIKKVNPENNYPVRKGLQEGERALNAGELNYQIFFYIKHNFDGSLPYYTVENTVKQFVNNFLGDKPNYQKYNDVTGALIRCTKELKRRLQIDTSMLINIMESYDKTIDEYEDLKINENGDVE